MKENNNSLMFFIWVVGFLFTIGITANTLPQNIDIWQGIITMIVYFIFWPLILGVHFIG